MADADGATKFCDIEKVEAGLNDLDPKPVWPCSDFVLLSAIHVLIEGGYYYMAILKNVCLHI